MSDEGAVFQDSPREMADGEFSDASLYDTLRTPSSVPQVMMLLPSLGSFVAEHSLLVKSTVFKSLMYTPLGVT